MLFPEEDAPLLKAWIVKRIENTSDADSDVLADYVIALLKHDGDPDSVRKLCEQEIPDFLTEEPKAFLDDVFQAITWKSYRPGAPPAPPARPTEPPPTTGKKRGFEDGPDEANGHSEQQRAPKQPRRGGRRGRQDGPVPVGNYALPSGMPPFDPNNPLEAMMQMQAMGMTFPGFPGMPGPRANGGRRQQQQRRKGRCRDFDTKGFCSRGSTCMYDHGNESVYIPQMMPHGDEYDPNDASLMNANHTMLGGNPFSFTPDNNHNNNNRGRGGRRGRGGKKGGARAPFSADGPVHDRSKTTIVVESIPEDHFSEEQVRDFFSQFGDITDVSMQPYKRLAIVKYDKWGSANAAYRSPKVIFDNRFVKVFWHRDVDGAPPASKALNGGNGAGNEDEEQQQHDEPPVDPEEFQRRQEEAQRQYHEKETKRTEIEQKRQELQQQQQDLLAKHRLETERLQARLAAKDGGDAAAPSASLSTGPGMLRAKLALLEQEAKILGIDPDADADADADSYRGGYRGRGGAMRGRGYAPRWRGSFRGRGGAAAGGSESTGRHAAYAQYSIDNRPKTLAVTGADFTSSERDEMLRHFLLNLGEFESVTTSPSVTHVSFPDRKAAEKFYYSLHGKELPNVAGKLDLSWVNNPPDTSAAAAVAAVPSSSSLPAAAVGKPVVDDAQLGDAMAGMDDHDTHEQQQQPQQPQEDRHVDMDYDVGDDDAWGE